MSEINAAQVMKLRNKTGLSMMECKKALQEAKGDEQAAEDILRKKLKAPATLADDIEAVLRDQLVVPTADALLPLPVRDEDDAWVLASAVAGDAELLVTGGKDLLAVASDSPVPILPPREAWERLRRPGAA